MIKANFNTYNTYVTDSLYQWDLNQVLTVSGLNLADAPEVHFSNANTERAIVKQATNIDHIVSVKIPNSLLQDALTIKAHIGLYEGDTFKVVELIEIPVIARKKPIDYRITDKDEEIYSFNRLENMIEQIDEKWSAFTTASVDVAVDNWLSNHPEATTTVQDKTIGFQKLTDDVYNRIDNSLIRGERVLSMSDYSGTHDEIVTAVLSDAIAIVNQNESCTIVVDKVYEITSEIIVDKPNINRNKITFLGKNSGGFYKRDGYLFKNTNICSDVDFINIVFKCEENGSLVCFNDRFINMNLNECEFAFVSGIVVGTDYVQNVNIRNCEITFGNGSLLKSVAFFGCNITENLIENRTGALIEDIGNVSANAYGYWGVNIKNNLIENNVGTIIAVRCAKQLVIDSNYFEKNTAHLQIDTSYEKNIIVSNNIVTQVGGESYFCKILSNAILNRLEFISNTLPGIYLCDISDWEAVDNQPRKITSRGNTITTVSGEHVELNTPNLHRSEYQYLVTTLDSDIPYLSVETDSDGNKIIESYKNGRITQIIEKTVTLANGQSIINLPTNRKMMKDEKVTFECYSDLVFVKNCYPYWTADGYLIRAIVENTKGSACTVNVRCVINLGNNLYYD